MYYVPDYPLFFVLYSMLLAIKESCKIAVRNVNVNPYKFRGYARGL